MTVKINFVEYIPLPGHEEELAKNKHAKCYREVEVSIGQVFTTIKLCSVTKEAANGGYRPAPTNVINDVFPTNMFLDGDESFIKTSKLSKECWVVGSALLDIQKKMMKSSSMLTKTLAIA